MGMSRATAVLDVAQPSSPTLVGTVPVPTISLARAGTTLYAGTSSNGLAVLDISNPASPAIVRTLALPNLAIRVRVYGNLLLVADNAAGLLIYDISNPRTPTLLSQQQGFAAVADVAVDGTKAYVAADVDGLGIVDITNPARPVLISKTGLGRIDPFNGPNPPNEALTIALNNGLVYVGTLYDNGLVFGLDCTNPSVPRMVSVNAYSTAILEFTAALLFNGNELFVGGVLNGSVYPVAEVNMSQPLDSINQYFPPAALRSPAQTTTSSPAVTVPKGAAARKLSRFHREP